MKFVISSVWLLTNVKGNWMFCHEKEDEGSARRIKLHEAKSHFLRREFDPIELLFPIRKICKEDYFFMLGKVSST